MKYKIVVLLLVVFYKSYSCSCVHSSLIDKINTHDYIARIKITESKTIGNLMDSYKPYFVKIETVKQYFGNKIIELHLESMCDASCGMFLPKDTEWIIFGFKNKENGKIYTSLCSGNFQLNKTIDSVKYQNYHKDYPKQQIKILNILKELKIEKIKKVNNKLSHNTSKDGGFRNALLSINNFDSKKTFGCFKLIHNKEGEVVDIEIINSLGKKIDKKFKKELIGSKWIHNKIDDVNETFEHVIIINYNRNNTNDGTLKYSLENY